MKKTIRLAVLTAALALVASPAFAGKNSASNSKKKTAINSQLRKECLQENPNLKGKTLQTCIKTKRKAS